MHFSGVEYGGGGLEVPRAEPLMKNLQGSQWGPLHPRTENFMFVLSQEAHVSLVGREKRVGRPTGKLLSSFVPGGWVSTAEVKSG